MKRQRVRLILFVAVVAVFLALIYMKGRHDERAGRELALTREAAAAQQAPFSPTEPLHNRDVYYPGTDGGRGRGYLAPAAHQEEGRRAEPAAYLRRIHRVGRSDDARRTRADLERRQRAVRNQRAAAAPEGRVKPTLVLKSVSCRGIPPTAPDDYRIAS